MDIPGGGPDRHDAGATTSEFDGALDGAEDEDENMGEPEVDDSDESDEEAQGSADERIIDRKDVKKVCGHWQHLPFKYCD